MDIDNTKTARILIAEDSAAMRAFLVSALETIGDCEVVEASSGFEALKQLPQRKFNLIITDINMPDINGLELISFIKNNEAYRHIPLMVVTTEGRDRDKEKGIAMGVDIYLVKPLDLDVFTEAVRKLVCGEDAAWQ
jgi:two-component system chemotaxis response regulator CheY